MKFKAEMGHWSGIVGNSVLLIGEDGRVLGQIAIMCQDDRLREKDVQTELCEKIYTALNADLCASGQVQALEWKDDAPFFDDDPDSVIYSEAEGAGYTYIAEAVDCTLEEAKAAAQAEYERRILAALTPAPQPEVATPTAQEAVPACKHLRTTHSRPGYDPLRPVVITCDDCGAVLSPDAHPPQPSESVAEAALKEARANMQHIKERLVGEWPRNGTLELIETHQRKIDAALRALKGSNE